MSEPTGHGPHFNRNAQTPWTWANDDSIDYDRLRVPTAAGGRRSGDVGTHSGVAEAAEQERAGDAEAVVEVNMEGFGPLLNRYREERRVSQSEIGRRTGYDHSYVSRLLNGSRLPSREAVQKLSAALNLNEQGTERLFAAAGFLPVNGGVFANPLLRDVNALLTGELSADVRTHAIMGLSLVKDYLERAGTGGAS